MAAIGTARDLAYGQPVIIAARWILALAGLLLALWNPGSVRELRIQILVILVLAVANFYLHAQVLRRRLIPESVAYGASVADAGIITLLVLANGGFDSNLYIFYFPAILAFSVAFSTMMTLAFAGGAMALYALVSLATMDGVTDANLQTLITRLVMLAAAAVCGNVYWRIEADRRRAAVDAQEGQVVRSARGAAQEAAEDLFFGQVVIIWARWFLILAGAILTLWSATTVGEITAKILLVVILMAMNFFLHGRYLMEHPANRTLIGAASALDLLVITGAILLWQGQGGLHSQFFIFYYPVLLAFAFVFPPRLAFAYTGGAMALYTVTCLVADPSFIWHVADLKLLVMRLITLAAVGGLATYYWRIQRDRRRGTIEGAPEPTIASGTAETAQTADAAGVRLGPAVS